MLPQSKKRVEEKPEEPVAYPVYVQNNYYGYPQYYYKAPKPKLESSGDAYKIRLWFYVILVPILWWLACGLILPLIFFLPYFLMGLDLDNAINFGSIVALILSFFITIRIYSFCTNNRELPFSLSILFNYDSRVESHLFNWPREKNAFSITGAGMFLDFIVGWSILYLMAIFMGLSFEDDMLVGVMSDDLLFFISTFLLIAVVTPVVEELLFRGFVLDLLSEAYGKWTSIFISSIIFGLLHIFPFTILNAFCGGLIYGYIRIRTNSLWPSIILHALWNGHLIVLEFFYL